MQNKFEVCSELNLGRITLIQFDQNVRIALITRCSRALCYELFELKSEEKSKEIN